MATSGTSISENTQPDLFGASGHWPPGLVYQPELLTRAEESILLDHLNSLPFANASYREWTARRRVVGFGGKFDFDRRTFIETDPPPDFLKTLRNRVGAWCGIHSADFHQVLVSEYAPGTPLGWHRDAPCFDTIAGISLAGVARMRWRPYVAGTNTAHANCHVDLAPRSAYIMRGAARWDWQHAISPTKTLRYSITFRTLR
jgi:alkylated DNA repair dioxygenase AlkB